MCGIVAYIGDKQAYPIIIKGLHRLEYRGYDSAGIALLSEKLNVYKTKGRVSNLEDYIKKENKDVFSNIGMGHTRWATHGEPSSTNAHPHFSQNQEFAIIHNGIIENYSTLKESLIDKGYVFKSDTDTEVLAFFIEEVMKSKNLNIEDAFRVALKNIVGAYAIVLISKNKPDTLYAARKASPLVIGFDKGYKNYYIASDATPIVEHTKKVIYLKDEEIAIIKKGEELKIIDINNKNSFVKPIIKELEFTLEALAKGGFEHFMLKEIFEQPHSVRDCMRGRLNLDKGVIALGGISNYEEKLLNAKRLIIIACGTSWHAGLIGEYLIENLVRIPVEVEYASEFRYRNPIINEDDIIIAISQSGETADTLAAIELAKSKGTTIIGICNVVGSSIPRTTHAGSYTHAGPEIGVASTKAFTAQVTILTLLALQLAYKKNTITKTKFFELINEFDTIPDKIQEVLNFNDKIEELAEKFKDVSNALYLGRGYNYPIALEGALKLKEISYIHAEGYPAAEMKHGPIALIDDKMPVIVIATHNGIYEKIKSNIREVKARKGIVIAIVSENDKDIKKMADYSIEIPPCNEIFVPLLATIPLQLFAYYIAVKRGCDVDKPRNLAKSVTVE